ncbi:PAS domain S-box [Desulfosporosinus orientis DSM 765]|uniref:histidine kinase n=1 Tax=Desulfosporosinus orientis (strain ATCC 19365 / DSM 765 / NCIMB 8382 / VKM B-1628 / Singapore I) TaxID=768706 RepID=G7WHB4_DESOD|nr:ATP-binding protein [Desulfosporosinus orientis]AET70204.1 PAS domain S-box [Desulfosporosinus orientis DSM 765]
MSLRWRLTGLFLGMTGLSLLLFWVGDSARLVAGKQQSDLGVAILALLLPAGVVFFYANQLTRRMEKLHASTQRIASGDFEHINLSDSTDELGQFTIELNSLSRHVEKMVQDGTQEAHKMETILAGMEEGVVAVDHVGRIVLVNAAAERIFERQKTDRDLEYLLELTYDSELEQLTRKVLSGQPSAAKEIHIGQKTVQSKINPILSGHGKSRGAVIVFHDVTELRRLEQMRTEFVANVSHELRTPLTSIKGFVETLLDGAADDPALRNRFLKIIQDETLRLQRLIEDLLTIAHLEGHENRADAASDKVSYVQKAYHKIKPVILSIAQAKGIQVDVNLSEDLPPLTIGEDLLSQLLLNLLENAVKYTTEGRVWLNVQVEPQFLRLEFGDTGCGIPADRLPRIFERFYRVDKARSREQGGTGLGLSIVKHMVEGIGGNISVKSTLGVGTVFICNLPRAKH